MDTSVKWATIGLGKNVRGPLDQHESTLISAWINEHISSKCVVKLLKPSQIQRLTN